MLTRICCCSRYLPFLKYLYQRKWYSSHEYAVFPYIVEISLDITFACKRLHKMSLPDIPACFLEFYIDFYPSLYFPFHLPGRWEEVVIFCASHIWGRTSASKTQRWFHTAPSRRAGKRDPSHRDGPEDSIHECKEGLRQLRRWCTATVPVKFHE